MIQTRLPVLSSRSALLPALALSASLLTQPVLAQVERSGGSAVNSQLYQDYQQAVAARTQLQADNAKLKNDLADARQQLGSARSGAAGSQAALVAAQQAQGATQKSLEILKGQAGELVTRFRETVTQLRDVETDRSQLRQQLAENRAAYQQCFRDNDSLYQIDGAVLNLYSHQSLFSHLARAEPFTRLERTRLDNIALEYRERAAAVHLLGASTPDSALPGGPASAMAVPAPSHP